MGWISWAPATTGMKNVYYKREQIQDAQLLGGITKHIWSPCVWRGNRRKRDNFEFAEYCVLDFENPEVTMKDIERKFADCWYIIGPTRNHGLQKGTERAMDRFRLVLKWPEPITCLRTYEHTLACMAETYRSDPSATDGARIFLPCTKIESAQIDDENLLFQQILPPPPPAAGIDRPYEARLRAQGRYSKHTIWALTNEVKRVNPGRNRTFFKVACELARQVTPEGERAVPIEMAEEIIFESPTYAGKHHIAEYAASMARLRDSIKSAYKANPLVIHQKSSK